MSTYDLKLKSREEIAEGTMAFHLEKPDGFSFKPGQAIDVVIIDPLIADAQNNRHAFSIVSAPFEAHLTVATRLRDSVFKRTLKSLATGSPIQIEGPLRRARAAKMAA